MNVVQSIKKDTPAPAPASNGIAAWAKAHKGAIAIGVALVALLVVWNKFEGDDDGGDAE